MNLNSLYSKLFIDRDEIDQIFFFNVFSQDIKHRPEWAISDKNFRNCTSIMNVYVHTRVKMSNIKE